MKINPYKNYILDRPFWEDRGINNWEIVSVFQENGKNYWQNQQGKVFPIKEDDMIAEIPNEFSKIEE
jgi:hypothetical protein